MEGWMGSRVGLDRCGKLAHTGIPSLDRPARSEQLYRLSYRGLFSFTDTNDKNEFSDYRYHEVQRRQSSAAALKRLLSAKLMLQYDVRTYASVTVQITRYTVTEQRQNLDP